jgi:predicted RNA-binding Zn ribbon-like protein
MMEEKFKDLSGESLCLDFVNTVSWRGRESSKDYFTTYSDLLLWSRYVKIISEKDFNELLQKANIHTNEAQKTIKRAIDLREAIYSVFSARTEGRKPPDKDLLTFNDFLSRTMCHSRIKQTDDGFVWDTDGDKNSLDWILNPVIRSAAELLTSSDFRKVKLCGDKECGWIFLDSSRNQSRRWCDMKDCGNRAKARRFYWKKKSEQKLP